MPAYQPQTISQTTGAYFELTRAPCCALIRLCYLIFMARVTYKSPLIAVLTGMLCVAPGHAWAYTFEELISQPALETVETKYTALTLEHCIASGLSKWLPPIVFRGEGVTEIYVNPNPSVPSTVAMAFKIKDTAQTRIVQTWASGKFVPNWEQRSIALVHSCAGPKSVDN